MNTQIISSLYSQTTELIEHVVPYNYSDSVTICPLMVSLEGFETYYQAKFKINIITRNVKEEISNLFFQRHKLYYYDDHLGRYLVEMEFVLNEKMEDPDQIISYKKISVKNIEDENTN